MKDELVFIEMSEFDYRLALHIRMLRKNKYSQQELSLKIGHTKSFVGNVESLLSPKQYGTGDMTLLAKAFGYKSMDKLFKFPTPEHDWVRLTLRIIPALKKDGTPSKEKIVEVIKVEPWVKTENKKEKGK